MKTLREISFISNIKSEISKEIDKIISSFIYKEISKEEAVFKINALLNYIQIQTQGLKL